MSKIREIQQKISKSYKDLDAENASIEIPIIHQTLEWIGFSSDFIRAASLVNENDAKFLLTLPRLQLTGQAVENALKACIVSTGTEPQNSHNLVQLYETVENCGFSLDEPNQAWIVHLTHFYNQDISTSTKFKTRYPTKTSERLGGAVPEHSKFASLIQLLCEQAKHRYQQQVECAN